MQRHILSAVLGLSVLAGAPAMAQEAKPAPWTTLRAVVPLPTPRETGRMNVGDVELYYAIYGKGRPVLLIHPGLGHGDYWANQVGPLSQEYQVIVVDLRGHGRSTRSDTPLSYGLLAEDLTRLMQKLHVGKPAIVGWGDGAIVGLEMAMRHPGRVSELIAFGLTYDTTGQRTGVDTAQTFVEYVHKTAADYQRMAPEPKNFDATFQQLEALWAGAPHYTPEQLATVKVPTAVLIAQHDEWVVPEHSQKAAQLIPGAQMLWLSKVSHFAPWQQPKSFNDSLRLILKY